GAPSTPVYLRSFNVTGTNVSNQTWLAHYVAPSAPRAPLVFVPSGATQGYRPSVSQDFHLGSFTDDHDGGNWNVSVDWGDGTTATTFTVDANATMPFTFLDKPHSYTTGASSYNISVTVTDSTGLIGANSFPVVLSTNSTTSITASPSPVTYGQS